MCTGRYSHDLGSYNTVYSVSFNFVLIGIIHSPINTGIQTRPSGANTATKPDLVVRDTGKKWRDATKGPASHVRRL
jgi:hypothetical protein